MVFTKEGVLKLSLTALSIILWIAPLIAAFGASGWDLQTTLAPREDIESLTSRTESIVTSLEDVRNSIENAWVGWTDELTLEVKISLSVPEGNVRIDNFSANAYCATHDVFLGTIKLQAPVELSPETSGEVAIVLTLTREGKAHIDSAHGGENSLEIRIENLQVAIYGIKVSIGESLVVTIPLGETV